MTHTCKVCGVTSDVAEFYRSVNTRCKDCHKRKVKENRAANADYYREYDAKRFQNDPRVKERLRKYQSTPAGKAVMQKSREKWLKDNPEKRAAHIILGNAVRGGRVKKPDICQMCGAKHNRIEGHHHDYAMPLVVVWLCRNCHAEQHRKRTT